MWVYHQVCRDCHGLQDQRPRQGTIQGDSRKRFGNGIPSTSTYQQEGSDMLNQRNNCGIPKWIGAPCYG